MTQETIKLASGHQMPLVGFGLWKVPKESAADTVYNVSLLPFSPSRIRADEDCRWFGKW